MQLDELRGIEFWTEHGERGRFFTQTRTPMEHRPRLYALIALAVLAIVIANGQPQINATKHYEEGGLSFDYPSDWEITENSSGRGSHCNHQPHSKRFSNHREHTGRFYVRL